VNVSSHQLHSVDLSTPVPASGSNARELVVTTIFTEQHLASRDIEEQTKVPYQQAHVFLWVAIKSVLEGCFFAWSRMSGMQADRFIK
jgi:hypothetical protein